MASKKTKQEIVREQPMTYDHYAALDDGNRYELVDGQLELMSPAPTVSHQVISFQIQKHIAHTCEKDYLILYAPVDLILSPTEVRQPDLVLIQRSRLHIISKRGIEGAPDLVVEILSPSTRRRDKIGKLKTYAKYQIPEYWIVEPESGTLEQYQCVDGIYQLTDIYSGEEVVGSIHIPCVSFTMEEIMRSIADLPL
jgi:Uma2 family endonuclease